MEWLIYIELARKSRRTCGDFDLKLTDNSRDSCGSSGGCIHVMILTELEDILINCWKVNGTIYSALFLCEGHILLIVTDPFQVS